MKLCSRILRKYLMNYEVPVSDNTIENTHYYILVKSRDTQYLTLDV